MGATLGEVKILDYTNSQIVAIDVGSARIQSGTVRLIHVVDLGNYETLIDNIDSAVKSNVSTSHPIHPYLIHEIQQIRNHLEYLKPRNKRSLNFIGSAWKWVAGNPDHDDFAIIEQKINNVLENNNRQVIINKMSLEKINEITSRTNEILKFTKSIDWKDSLIDKLKYKLNIVKDEIINLQYAIHWAKVGVLNSFILSSDEMKLAKNLFDSENITYLNLEESFEFSEIKIATNHHCLLYIISIPTTKKEYCNSLIITPVKSGKISSKIEFDNVLECEEKMYGIKNKCKSYNKLTLCKDDQIEDISESKCLPKLIRSKPSNCTLINNHRLPMVQEILPGSLLLNQFNGTIFIGHESYDLNGTFLIKFYNETVSVNDRIFSLSETTISKPLPAVIQPRMDNPYIEETLTLESVREMHVNNSRAIALLNDQSQWGDVISYSLVILVILLIIFVCPKKRCKSTNEKYPINCNLSPSTPIQNIYVSDAETGGYPISRITQIPYF